MLQRPDTFRYNYLAPLAQGLKCAGLGFRGSDRTTHFQDSSLYGNHGTLTNMDPATDWVFDTTIGRWVVTHDATNDWTALPDILGAAAAYSASVWLYKSTVTYSGFIIGRVQAGGTGQNWGLYQSGSTQKLACFVTTAGGAVSHTESTATGNGWHHICGVYDGATVTLYVDGIAKASPPAQSGVLTTTNGYLTGISPQWSTHYTGFTAGDVCVWNRALSLSEIQQLADPSNVMLSGLVLPPRRKLWPVATSGTYSTTIEMPVFQLTI